MPRASSGPSARLALCLLAMLAGPLLTPDSIRAQLGTGGWARHSIDDTSRGADGVRLMDLDGDGLLDVVTGWEEGGVIRLYLNPGRSAVRQEWAAATVGEVRAPEDAVPADLDGDGGMDVVSASEGQARAVQIHWAPRDRSRYMDPAAWTTKFLPATQGRQWMFLLPMELDGRNGTDLIVGSKGEGAMIGWLESPADPREPDGWKLHKLVDAGWVMSLIAHDMDGDGNQDVVASDRYGDHAGVFWLENPGAAGSRARSPWRVHEIGAAGREVMFVDVADLERDGRAEVIAAVKRTDVLIMRQGQSPSGSWSTQTLTLDSARVGTAKAVRVADLTLDGAPELLLTFEHAAGSKAGVVWTTLPSGTIAGGSPIHDVSGPEGVEFDLAALVDLDEDGDLDVITTARRRSRSGWCGTRTPAGEAGAGRPLPEVGADGERKFHIQHSPTGPDEPTAGRAYQARGGIVTDNRSGRRDFLQKMTLLGAAGSVPLLAGSTPLSPEARVCNIVDFGARGDGVTNDAVAIQAAIDRCAQRGGGTVLVPSGGKFLTGTIELKSNVHFLVDTGAEILASLNSEHYREGTLILAKGADNLTLSGRGAINAQGRRFMREELPHIFRPRSWRPRMIVLEGCSNLRMRDLTLRESALWTVHLAGCQDVAIQGLSILNDRKIPNCDGIAVDSSKNVRISDCHIEAGDDCIVLKTLRQFAQYGACENVTVQGCTLYSTSAALKIGTETVNDIRNIVFNNCVIRDSSRGLGIMLRDEGTVENVLFSNMTVETRYPDPDWWGVAEPIHISALPRNAGQRIGRVRNVRFSNLVCRSENGAVLHGSGESVPEDVLLENVKIRLEKWVPFAGGKQDLRPSDGVGVSERPSAGIYARKIRDLLLHRCSVEWGDAVPEYFGSALEAHDVEGLHNVHFRGVSAQPDRIPAQRIG